MGKIYDLKIDTFSGGISEDKRSKDFSKFSLTKHFDTYTYPHKLVPYHATATPTGIGGADISAYRFTKLTYAPYLSAGAYRLYALGLVATTKATVYQFDVGDSPASSNWAEVSNSESSTNTRNPNVFFYYKDWIYMWRTGTHLIRYSTTGSAFEDTYQAVSYVGVVQPVRHPNDDIAYFPVNLSSATTIYKQTDNASGWSTALTGLPADMMVTAICPYGNYLAITCVTRGSFDPTSVVYLWDRDSSITTLTERIDFGKGKIVHLANLNNRLTAVVDLFLSSAYGAKKGKLLVKQVNGVFGVTVSELTTDSDNGGLFQTATIVSPDAINANSVVKDNKLYFPARVDLNGDTRIGIYVVDSNGRVTLDYEQESATSYDGIFLLDNTWWVAYNGAGAVGYTSYVQTYSTTLSSVYESLIINGGDSSAKKKLIGVTVDTEPLPTNGQIVLKYRKDEETSWTTIFTEATDNSISYSAINIKSSGANLPTIWKEIQFQVNSTGGAVVTGIKCRYEIEDRDLY